METGHLSTRAVNSGSGNRALLKHSLFIDNVVLVYYDDVLMYNAAERLFQRAHLLQSMPSAAACLGVTATLRPHRVSSVLCVAGICYETTDCQ